MHIRKKSFAAKVLVSLSLFLFLGVTLLPDIGSARRGRGKAGVSTGGPKVVRPVRAAPARITARPPSSLRSFSNYGSFQLPAGLQSPSAALSPLGIFAAAPAPYNPFWTGAARDPFGPSEFSKNPFQPSDPVPNPFITTTAPYNPFSMKGGHDPFVPTLTTVNPFLSSTVMALYRQAAAAQWEAAARTSRPDAFKARRKAPREIPDIMEMLPQEGVSPGMMLLSPEPLSPDVQSLPQDPGLWSTGSSLWPQEQPPLIPYPW